MIMYKLTERNNGVYLNGIFIPFAPDNTDYAQFKKNLSEGASLKDAEGNDMTAEQITTFLGTLT